MYSEEFKEIAHCGGKYTLNVITDGEGRRCYNVGCSHSSPRPASIMMIYALEQGIPIGTARMGGLSDAAGTPQQVNHYQILIGSDSHGCFGHSCPRCQGYWRTHGRMKLICPYCGLKANFHDLLTDGQRRYVSSFCEMISEKLFSDQDGEFVIDMDHLADEVLKSSEKPAFYYAEESQQHKYKCNKCKTYNDILGKFGFCSGCGERTEWEIARKEIQKTRDSAVQTQNFNDCLCALIRNFDSIGGSYINVLIKMVPLHPKRKSLFDNKRFHNVEQVQENIKTVFAIDLRENIKDADYDFLKRMFHRRHVYEHKGGVVDQKYLDDSCDNTVRLNQAISETMESFHNSATILQTMLDNLHKGFHQIFPAKA